MPRLMRCRLASTSDRELPGDRATQGGHAGRTCRACSACLLCLPALLAEAAAATERQVLGQLTNSKCSCFSCHGECPAYQVRRDSPENVMARIVHSASGSNRFDRFQASADVMQLVSCARGAPACLQGQDLVMYTAATVLHFCMHAQHRVAAMHTSTPAGSTGTAGCRRCRQSAARMHAQGPLRSNPKQFAHSRLVVIVCS